MYLFISLAGYSKGHVPKIKLRVSHVPAVKSSVGFIFFLSITLMRRMPRLTWGRADRHTSGKGCTNLFIERVAEKLRRITWERKEELEKQ